jgi:hypothetical protein
VRTRRTLTDAEGRFAFPGLEGGRYAVELLDGQVRTERPLRLADGDVVDLDLEVFEGVLAGRVLTLSGRPVSGAEVVATPRGPAQEGFEARGLTDPEGRFTLAGLPFGGYDVAASAPGLPPGRLEGATADLPGAAEDLALTLGAGGTVRLLVEDELGRGITGARVWLEDPDGLPLHPRPFSTAPGGRLDLLGVPAGDVRLAVHATGYGRPPRRAVRVAEGATEEVRFVLGRPAALTLAVTGPRRDPVALVRVDLLRAPGLEVVERRRPLARVRLSDPWGFAPRAGVLLFDDLAAGSYVVRVDAGPTFATRELTVVLRAGEETRLDLALEAAPR